MTQAARTTSRSEVARVLRRVGYPADVINELVAQLDDPVDADRDRHILERYGVTRERLMKMIGASP